MQLELYFAEQKTRSCCFMQISVSVHKNVSLCKIHKEVPVPVSFKYSCTAPACNFIKNETPAQVLSCCNFTHIQV